MSRKPLLPGVDQEALAALARQFPSSGLNAGEYGRDGEARFGRDEPVAAGAVSAAPPAKAKGRGLAFFAILLALLAILIAASAVAPPRARVWLTKTIGDSRVVNVLTGNRADLDARLAAASGAIDGLERKATEIAARLAAIEAVGGSSNTAATRVAALEAAMTAANARLAAEAEGGRAAEARIGKLEEGLTALGGDLKVVADRLAAAEEGVKVTLAARLGAVETDVGALKKIDRRAEKLFLVVLQLRAATQTSGPFAREVAAAQALAGDNPDLLAALKQLAVRAPSGVATVAELRENFNAVVAPRLAAIVGANQQGVGERARAWVQSLLATSPSAGATGGRNATIVALAERSLEQGQLGVAVDQLLLLEDQAALVTAEWLKSASARLATNKATAAVMAQAFDQLVKAN